MDRAGSVSPTLYEDSCILFFKRVFSDVLEGVTSNVFQGANP